MFQKKDIWSSFMLRLVVSVAAISISLFATLPVASLKTSPNDDLKVTIEKLLSVQAKAWNDGDLERFMTTYWKSDKLSFSSGGQTTFGWQATLDRYKLGYAPPKEMGTLKFDELKVFPIEANSALALGNWHLKMKDDSRRDGNFSLVIKKIEGIGRLFTITRQ